MTGSGVGGSRRIAVLSGVGTKLSSGGEPTGLNGSIGGRFLSGGISWGAGVGLGTKPGARDGGGSGVVYVEFPFGLPRDRGLKLSSPLRYEFATESWLLLFILPNRLSEGS